MQNLYFCVYMLYCGCCQNESAFYTCTIESNKRKQYYGLWTRIFDLKLKTSWICDGFVSYKQQLLSSPDVNWWTGVVWITCGLLWCFYQLFGLSFWRHPFTAEDHWWASDAMLHFSKSNEETTHLRLDCLRVSSTFSYFHLGELFL